MVRRFLPSKQAVFAHVDELKKCPGCSGQSITIRVCNTKSITVVLQVTCDTCGAAWNVFCVKPVKDDLLVCQHAIDTYKITYVGTAENGDISLEFTCELCQQSRVIVFREGALVSGFLGKMS